jgi:osmotically-inducible protein OsmY
MHFHKPNHLLESDVKEALDYDPLLDPSRIEVKASDGMVTLSGTVYTYAELVEAAEDTWSVGGVTALDNELLVGLAGAAVEDSAIAAAATEALGRDKFVPHGSVTPVVLDGWLTLNGEVRRHFQRKAAEFSVRRVDGVLGVTDDIKVNSGEPIPSDVADRINKAFARNAIIDDSKIQVSNSGHTIYLDGTVDSYTAMEQAEDTAWDAPGVDDVVDRMVIVP